MKPVTQDTVERALHAMTRAAIENEQYLCDLDGVVGDGDMGTSLATGFREVEAQWSALDRTSIGHLFQGVARIIGSKVGGCSGPLWCTAFMRAGAVAQGKSELTQADISEMFVRAIDGVKTRGGAEEGDKTLLDSLGPMSRAFDAGPADPLATCLAEAEKAIETSRDWVARRGRQSFTGDRSKGTLDPGTVAVAVMVRSIRDALREPVQA